MTKVLYAPDGRQFRFMGKLEDGRIVVASQMAIGFTNYYGDEVVEFEDYQTLVYADGYLSEEPPTQLLHEECANIQRNIEEKRKELAEADDKLRAVQSEHLDFLKRIKSYEQLRLVDDYFNGNIHYVVSWEYGSPNVFDLKNSDDVKSLLVDDDRYNRRSKLKLISLCADLDGDKAVRWNINRYTDGSGPWSAVELCRSQEEVREAIQRRVSEMFKENRLYGLVKVVEDYEIHLTDNQEWALSKYKEKQAENAETKRVKEVARLRKKLSELEPDTPETTTTGEDS